MTECVISRILRHVELRRSELYARILVHYANANAGNGETATRGDATSPSGDEEEAALLASIDRVSRACGCPRPLLEAPGVRQVVVHGIRTWWRWRDHRMLVGFYCDIREHRLITSGSSDDGSSDDQREASPTDGFIDMYLHDNALCHPHASGDHIVDLTALMSAVSLDEEYDPLEADDGVAAADRLILPRSLL